VSTATKLATYEDLLALPRGVKAEVIRGVLRTLPAPRPRHAKVQRVLGGVIGGPFDDDDGEGGPGGWYIFPEVDVPARGVRATGVAQQPLERERWTSEATTEPVIAHARSLRSRRAREKPAGSRGA
jgi:hypothetical protein